jgi:hypothetical protein
LRPLADIERRCIQILEETTGAMKKGLSFGRQPDTSRRAAEQRNPKVLLKLSYVSAQGWLRYPDAFRCATELPFLGDGNEASEPGESDGHGLNPVWMTR